MRASYRMVKNVIILLISFCCLSLSQTLFQKEPCPIGETLIELELLNEAYSGDSRESQKYTIYNQLSSSESLTTDELLIIKKGSMKGGTTVETHSFCLRFGASYTIQSYSLANDETKWAQQTGLVICNKYTSTGNTFSFFVSVEGCTVK